MIKRHGYALLLNSILNQTRPFSCHLETRHGKPGKFILQNITRCTTTGKCFQNTSIQRLPQRNLADSVIPKDGYFLLGVPELAYWLPLIGCLLPLYLIMLISVVYPSLMLPFNVILNTTVISKVTTLDTII